MFKKRTKSQIDASTTLGDYTGGYEFLPWLLYMRLGFTVGFFANLAGGIAGFVIFFQEYDWIGLGVGCFFGVIATSLIALSLIRDYKESKKGISR